MEASERGALDAGVTGDRGDGLGTVAGEHLQLDSLASEPVNGRACVWSEPFSEQDESARLGMCVLELVCVPEREHTSSCACGVLGLCLEAVEIEVLGRAKDVTHAANPLRPKATLR